MAKREHEETGGGMPAAEQTAFEPRLIIAGGRGKNGKSTLLRYCIEQFILRGGQPVIADCDRTNQTLAAFYPTTAKRPPSAEDEDVRLWLNATVDQVIEQMSTCYLDLGGGDLMLKTWAHALDLAPFLVSNNVTPVLLHVLGCDLDDLSYLRDLEEVYAPTTTAIILNEGLVPYGRSPRSAFTPLIEHPIFGAAVARGAKVTTMPRLGCMAEIDRRRISFADAAAGNVKSGQTPLGPTFRQEVVMWLRAMEAALAPIASWIA